MQCGVVWVSVSVVAALFFFGLVFNHNGEMELVWFRLGYAEGVNEM